MTLVLFFAMGVIAGWLVPRMMGGGEAYGIPVDFGVAVTAALAAGFLFKAAMGGMAGGAIAALLIASGCVFGMRQVKNARDKQQAVLAREAMRRRQARSR